MLKIKVIYPENNIYCSGAIEKSLNGFINSLKNKGNEIRNITYTSDGYGSVVMAIVEYYEDKKYDEIKC